MRHLCPFLTLLLFVFFLPSNDKIQAQNALDLSSGNITAGDLNELDGVSTFTLETWVKFNSIESWRNIFLKATVGTQRIGLQTGTNNNLYFLLGNGSNSYGYTASNVITTGVWYHITAVFDGTATGNSGRLKLYINGVQQSLSFGGTIPATTPTTSASLSFANNVNGAVDEIRIWNSALSSTTINSWKNEKMDTCHPDYSNLEVHWPLDGDANGASGTTINGVVSSGVYTSEDQTINNQICNPLPIISNALDLATGSVSAGDVNELDGVSAFTVETWVKFNSIQSWKKVFYKGSSATQRIGLQTGTSNNLYFLVGNGSNSYGYTPSNTITTGQWYHIAAVYNGAASGNSNKLKLYINGALQSLSYNGTIPALTPDTSEDLSFMSNVNGSADEIRVFNHNISPTTAKVWSQHGLNNRHPNYDNLKLYWDFNDEANAATSTARLGTAYGGVVANAAYNDDHIFSDGRLALENEFEVVMYLPEYRNINAIENGAFDHITNLVYFSIEPGSTGNLILNSSTLTDIALLKTKIGTRSTKLTISVGGWGRSGNFATMTANSTSRATFIENLKNFCLTNGLNGADIDWEFPNNSTQQNNAKLMLQEMQTAFAPHNLIITTAISPNHLSFAQLVAPYLDYVHMMIYDGGTPHSSLDYLINKITAFVNGGIPKSKIVAGVPFYGRKADNGAISYSGAYSFSTSPDDDAINNGTGTYYYNGPTTIANKAQYIVQQGVAGIMAWELGQDLAVSHSNSLLKAISEIIPINNTASSSKIASKKLVVVEDKELEEMKDFVLYPNPIDSQSILNVVFTSKEKRSGELRIYDQKGSILLVRELDVEQGKNNYSIELNAMKKGIYILKIQLSDQNLIKKLIVR